jgi:hypothetical protein
LLFCDFFVVFDYNRKNEFFTTNNFSSIIQRILAMTEYAIFKYGTGIYDIYVGSIKKSEDAWILTMPHIDDTPDGIYNKLYEDYVSHFKTRHENGILYILSKKFPYISPYKYEIEFGDSDSDTPNDGYSSDDN